MMQEYWITEYGAVADGVTNCAAAIQAAVDAAAQAGGGPGHGAGGAVSQRQRDAALPCGAASVQRRGAAVQPAARGHPPVPPCRRDDAMDGWNGGFFLGACGGQDITISGSGVIDGQGRRVFFDRNEDNGFGECPKAAAAFRPRMILLEDITDLTIRDVTLRDAAFWTLHMAGCRRVRIRDIRILNDDRGANNDGIDPDCCQDVIISGCLIHTGDDAIVVKATGR